MADSENDPSTQLQVTGGPPPAGGFAAAPQRPAVMPDMGAVTPAPLRSVATPSQVMSAIGGRAPRMDVSGMAGNPDIQQSMMPGPQLPTSGPTTITLPGLNFAGGAGLRPSGGAPGGGFAAPVLRSVTTPGQAMQPGANPLSGHVSINEQGRAAWVPDLFTPRAGRDEAYGEAGPPPDRSDDWSRAVDMPGLQDALSRGLSADIDEFGTRVGLNPYSLGSIGQYDRQWSDADIAQANKAISGAKSKKTMSAIRGIGTLLGPILAGVGGGLLAPAAAAGAGAGSAGTAAAGAGAGAASAGASGAGIGSGIFSGVQSGVTNAAMNAAIQQGLKGLMGGGWGLDWKQLLMNLGVGGLTGGAGAGLTGSGINPTLAKILQSQLAPLAKGAQTGQWDPMMFIKPAAMAGLKSGGKALTA